MTTGKAPWKPPKYPYKSATVKGLTRMLARGDIRGSLEEPFWLNPDLEETCKLYCLACGEDALHAARAARPAEGICLEGGRGTPLDADWAATCETCHAPLDVCLTEHGLEEALEYLESDEAELRTLHDYTHLLVVLEGGEAWYAWNDGDPRKHRLLASCARLLGLDGGGG